MADLSLVSYRKPANRTDQAYRLVPKTDGVYVEYVMRANQSYPDFAGNLAMVIEHATGLRRRNPSASAPTRRRSTPPANSPCYYNLAGNETGAYPGLDDEDVLEIVMWQFLSEPGYIIPPEYNTTLEYNMTELYAGYDLNFFAPDTLYAVEYPMSAVGIQCTSSSAVGTADIDGVHSTYTNFIPADTPIYNQSSRCAWRFGSLPLLDILDFKSSTTNWVSNFFTSSAKPPPFYAQYVSDIDAGTGITVQLSYLQPSDMRILLLRAYAAYAVQLMFNDGRGSSTPDGSRISSPNPNVTAYLPGSVLSAGVVAPEIPAVLFVLWGICVLSLSLSYGFRRRWSATLDGYSLFRFGADLSEAGKGRVAAFSNTLEVDKCDALHDLPGFVGDKRPQAVIGHIALVDGVAADNRSGMTETLEAHLQVRPLLSDQC